jgi:putative oxidoreductase
MNTRAQDYALLMLRIAVAIIMVYFGAQKLFGIWGGHGLEKTLSFFVGLGIPKFLAWFSITAEFLGGIGLFVGLFTRLAAFGIFVNLVVATIFEFTKLGGLNAAQPMEAIGFPALIAVVSIVFLIMGAGRISFDWAIWGKRGKSKF